ncbi:MAG: hypothetical protein ACYC2G_16540 [Gemmatimonadaceae bacterium]
MIDATTAPVAPAADDGDRRPRNGEAPADRGDAGPERGGDTGGSSTGGISPLEWVAAALGGLIVLSVVVFLLWHGMAGVDGPPDVTVSVDRVTAQSDGFHVGFEARNDGAAPAMALTVEAVLTMPGGEVERLETVLDYLPAQSSRGGGFVFADDPRLGRLELRAVSYQEP